MKRSYFIIIFSLVTSLAFSQKVVPLYNGERPPGSEFFPDCEEENRNGNGEVTGVMNVSMPTLTVYQPAQEMQNGTAVILCPGGGFRYLSMVGEGVEVAQWLTAKGITVFLLKYRLTPESAGTKREMLIGLMRKEFARVDSVNSPYVPYAIADGKEAIRYVRTHAASYNIDITKIGMMGFSAGGALCAFVAMGYEPQSRPDFVAPIYAYCSPIEKYSVPEDAPPMFLAFATDDFIADGNTLLYKHWKEVGKSVEMHSFSEGGHGFGIKKKMLTSDYWTVLFLNWMHNIKML